MDSESQHQQQHQPPPPPQHPHLHQNHLNNNSLISPQHHFQQQMQNCQNPNQSSNLSGFLFNSGASVDANSRDTQNQQMQNPNQISNLSGFLFNSNASVDANSRDTQNQQMQNPNQISNLSGVLFNSGASVDGKQQNVNRFVVNSSGAVGFSDGNQQMEAAKNGDSGSKQNRFLANSSGVGNSGAAVEFPDGSGASRRASGLSIEQHKKKRGRPRKYSPEGGGNVALGLSPSAGSGGDFSGGGNGAGADSSGKKCRGRPPGSGKRQLDALGAIGVGFTPHVISVKAGEDISSKIMSFAQQGPRTVCILSATGSTCNVTLRQPGMSGGKVTYEGRYEIISLAGSFHPIENGSRAGALSISLADSEGKVMGGSVAGMLVAASPIQVIVGSFVSDFKKQKAKPPSAAPSSNILNFSAPASGVASSPSQGASSESSEENHDSPLNHGQGPYNNASQPMQNMAMYSPISWTNSIKMPPN